MQVCRRKRARKVQNTSLSAIFYLLVFQFEANYFEKRCLKFLTCIMKESKVCPVSEYNTELKLKGFNAFQIEADSPATRIYSRKDFYKICLTTGKSIIHYADRSFEHEGTVLFFCNLHIPYSWETISTTYVGYTCLFFGGVYQAV